MIKKLILFVMCLFLMVGIACAGEKTITFAWNQEISPDFAGWKLYKATAPNVAVTPANLAVTIPYGISQTEYTSAQIFTSPDGQEVTYYFVLTAFDTAGNESLPSNEVFTKIDFLAPTTPIQFKIKIVGN